MNKLLCALFVAASVAVVTGCDEKKPLANAFVGQWKAISKEDGTSLHPKFNAVLDITCSENTCHMLSKKRTVLSDDEMVTNTDWDIKNESTLMKGNGLVSVYIKEGKLIANDIVYEKQKE